MLRLMFVSITLLPTSPLHAGVWADETKCNTHSITAVVGPTSTTRDEFEASITSAISYGQEQNEIVGGAKAVTSKTEFQQHYDNFKTPTGRTAYVISHLANGKTCYFPYYSEPVAICNPTSTCRDF